GPNMVFHLFTPSVRDSTDAARVDRDGLAWFDLFYQRRFVPAGNQLAFETPAAGVHALNVGPFALPSDSLHDVRVLDVTWPNQPVELTDLVVTAADSSVAFETNDDGVRRYRIVTGFTPLPQAQIADLAPQDNLRAATNTADYMV